MGIYDRSVTDNERYLALGKQAEADKQRREAEYMANLMGQKGFQEGLAAGFINAPRVAVNQELQDAMNYDKMMYDIAQQNKIKQAQQNVPSVATRVDQRVNQGLADAMAQDKRDYYNGEGVYSGK